VTLFRIAVRYQRTGLIVTALGGAAAGLLNAIAYVEIAGTTAAERAAFAQQMEILARQLSYLLPAPLQLDTLAGYLVWRAFGTIAIIYAFWAVLAGTGAARGDEERGFVEHWLSAGVSRTGWLITRAFAFVLVAAISIGVTLGATAAGALVVNEPLPLAPLVLQGVAMLALTLVAFGLGLAVSQLMATRRGASTLGGLVLLALFMFNSAGRSGVELGAIRSLSPFWLYDRSTPLLRDGSLDVGATAALFLTAAVLIAFATVAFVRRDIGRSLLRLRSSGARRTARPSRDPLLRMPVLAAFSQERFWIIGWAIGLAGLAAFLTSLTRTIVDQLSSSNVPAMRAYFERAGISAYSDFVGVIWFSTLLLLVSIFVVAQVYGWAADDAEGRLEVMLAAPVSRARVVLERIAVVLVAVGLVVAASSLAVYATASANRIELPAGRFVVASADVLPVAYAFAGIGHALVGWRPRLAVVALGTVAAVSYVVQQFAPLFDWPDSVRNISFYALYGTPLAKDDWPGIATLIAIGTAGTAVALLVMRRRDVGR
jgi:ABC-2 type transport system permease protein